MNSHWKSRERQRLLDRLLCGEIGRSHYERLLSELDQATSESVYTACVVEDTPAQQQEVIVATSDFGPAGSKPVALPIVEPGVELGHFRVEQRLGRGGMGEVWLAHDLVGERTVVIKFLHPEVMHHPEELASVKQVFRRVHNLQHQNICPVYLLGQDDRFGYYIVMKYVDGRTLSTYRRQWIAADRGFSIADVRKVLLPVAAALDYAHSQKVVHCDVKPPNIMIGSDGDGETVQLVDFGLSAEIRSSVSRLSSQVKEHGGTYPYMAPEQWRGEKLDGRVDQFALAVVAYELLAGYRPFKGMGADVLRLCILNDPPAPLEMISPAANAALERALSKQKTERFESCTAFLEALCAGDASSSERLPVGAESCEKTVRLRQLAPDEMTEIHSKPASVKPAESVIEQANRRALVWVGIALVACSVSFVGVTLGVMSLLRTAKPVGGLNHDVAAVQADVVSAETEATPVIPVKPAPVEPVLRYRWQPERAYVYSVSVDVERDGDRFVTYAGDLAYISLPPAAAAGPDIESQGTGTAFVIHSDGYLLTCQHVTQGATKLEVTLAGKSYTATVLGEDAEHDLAVIKIEATGLPFLKLANSEAVEQGEDVRAIGFPLSDLLGENIKATRGTVSGINSDDGRKVFQIDAPINPGNSGGPLVNEAGEVIGVIYAKLIEEVASGVGFATPANDAKAFLAEHQVQFVGGQASNRLDGPRLVKDVSAATALVSVTAHRGERAVPGRVTLRCTGTLTPRPVQKGVPATDTVISVQSLVFGALDNDPEADQAETDGMGRVHGVKGQGNLPHFLGHAARLIVELLPPSRRKTWSYSHPVTMTLQEESSPQRPPFGPRFGPRHFGPLAPWHQSPESSTREYPGTVRVEYVLGPRDHDLQTIRKKLDLSTNDAVAGGPRIQLKGEGDVVIDTRLGLPKQMDFAAELTERKGETTTKVPLKLKYQFVEERKLPAGVVSPQPVPLPVSATGQPVKPETAIVVGDKLVGEWADKWLPVRVLTVNGDGTVRIHWEGWSDLWDEDIPRARLRLPAR